MLLSTILRVAYLFSSIFIGLLSHSLQAKRCPLKYKQRAPRQIEKDVKGESAVIFIHGTVIPLLSPLTYRVGDQKGLVPYAHCAKRDQLIGEALMKASPQQHLTSNFYVYSWSGILSFSERRKAADVLYKQLRAYKGTITLIGHSHGASVALYLAQLAQEDNNLSFLIDRLIIFAPPVQSATAHHIKSPIFKRKSLIPVKKSAFYKH